MSVKKWRKLPVVIEAIRYTPPHNCGEVAAFLGEPFDCGDYDDPGHQDEPWSIPTLEGVMEALPGDYIIKGVAGEFYPCKPDVFLSTYEEV
jgi:hypothetical protein